MNQNAQYEPIRIEGREAGKALKGPDACPYPDGSAEQFYWIRGWARAYDAAHRKQVKAQA